MHSGRGEPWASAGCLGGLSVPRGPGVGRGGEGWLARGSPTQQSLEDMWGFHGPTCWDVRVELPPRLDDNVGDSCAPQCTHRPMKQSSHAPLGALL